MHEPPPGAPRYDWRLRYLRVTGICMQVTAYQVIQSSGSTGKMPTQVQFKIANPSDQSVGPFESCAHCLPCYSSSSSAS